MVGILALVPLGASFVFGETDVTFRYAAVILVLLIVGGGFARLEVSEQVQTNEAMVLAALLFLVTSVFMSFPLMASGMTFLDALFEAVSASTTTGLSMVAATGGMPKSFFFGRAWMQWYGGLGIVILSVALVIRPGAIAKGLTVTEAEAHDLVGGTKIHARRVLLVYAALTVVGIIVLSTAGIGFTNALLYSFAAISTGGFSPHDNSLAGLGNWPAAVLVTLICMAGAVPLVFYHDRFRRWRSPETALQVKALLLAGVFATLLIGFCMWLSERQPLSAVVVHAPLLALSAQTTTGFSTMSPANLDGASKLILIGSMIVGGGAGSTAGGFKLIRLIIVLQLLRTIILRISSAEHAVIEPRLAARRLQESEIHEAFLLIILFISLIFASWVPFVVMGYEPLDSLFEVVSATATVGLSTGITGPNLPAMLKGTLCVDMLLGRLEIIAWLIVLHPGTWIGRRRKAK
jgi:trk system potassium uptake protein TrkH